MTHARSGALALALLVCAAAPAGAQRNTFTEIRVGQTVNGTLSSTDPRLSDRGPFKVYRFEARQGQRLVITMRSGEFDSFLTLARTVAGITDQIETNDDFGGNTDARIRFAAPEAGQYLVMAQALAADGAGPYTLSLEEAVAPTTAEAQEIRLGQQGTGALAESDAMDDEDRFYDTWTLTGRAGQRLVVEMQGGFDTFLSLGRMEGEELTVIASNDDIGEGNTNSRVRVRLPADGAYTVRASSLGAEQTGAYTLSVLERADETRAIRSGETVSGELSADDDMMSDGAFVDEWRFTAREGGQALRMTMAADSFDAYLSVGRMSGGTFTEIASNDDGPDGTNSLLELTLPDAGEYVIRAKSLSGGQTGSYTLRVEPQMP